MSPCEFHWTLLDYSQSIRCFSHITGSDFAFLIVSWIWTNSRLLKMELHNHCAITVTYCDVLTQLLHDLLSHIIQHTTYLSSADYSMIFCDQCLSTHALTRFQLPPTTQIAPQPLTATSRTITLPFLILTNWLVLCGRQHHLFLLHLLTFLASQRLSKRYFHKTSFIITPTGLISERRVATVSRLA